MSELIKKANPAPPQGHPLTDHPAIDVVIDWIDRELGEAFGRSCGRGGNTLLELRCLFSGRSLNQLVFRFYALLPRLERHHYLLGYRIRTLFSSHYVIKLSDPLCRTPAMIAPLSFGHRNLQGLRFLLFEHAEVVIPIGDIRIEICRSETVDGSDSGNTQAFKNI